MSYPRRNPDDGAAVASVTIRLTLAEEAGLSELARAAGCSRSAVLVRLLRAAMASRSPVAAAPVAPSAPAPPPAPAEAPSVREERRPEPQGFADDLAAILARHR